MLIGYARVSKADVSQPLLRVLILLPAPPALAQSRDDFASWDASGNGDLTYTEAEERDEGLRLPAYQDNRDGCMQF